MASGVSRASSGRLPMRGLNGPTSNTACCHLPNNELSIHFGGVHMMTIRLMSGANNSITAIAMDEDNHSCERLDCGQDCAMPLYMAINNVDAMVGKILEAGT